MPVQPTILEEAQFLTRGNRNVDYGSPLDDYIRTAKIWSAILGTEVTAEQAMLCMIGVKLSRQCHRPKRDNLVDIAGYADCIDRAMEERERRKCELSCSANDGISVSSQKTVAEKTTAPATRRMHPVRKSS